MPGDTQQSTETDVFPPTDFKFSLSPQCTSKQNVIRIHAFFLACKMGKITPVFRQWDGPAPLEVQLVLLAAETSHQSHVRNSESVSPATSSFIVPSTLLPPAILEAPGVSFPVLSHL